MGWRRDGVQEGHDARADEGVRRADPGARHPERDQDWLFAHWLRAVRPLRLPNLEALLEDGQGDGWQEDGGPPRAEVERDGAVLLPAAAAARLRHLQELRGPLPRGFHGRQRRGDAREGGVLRAQGGGQRRRWQEEVGDMEGAEWFPRGFPAVRPVWVEAGGCSPSHVYKRR